MSETTISEDELVPVDYLILEFDRLEFTGEGLAIILDLVERGIVTVLDMAVVKVNDDGTVVGLHAEDLAEQGVGGLEVFIGASSGLLGQEDFDEVATVLAPGATAVALVYANTWAAPFVANVRQRGGRVVASGRVTVDDLLAAIEED